MTNRGHLSEYENRTVELLRLVPRREQGLIIVEARKAPNDGFKLPLKQDSQDTGTVGRLGKAKLIFLVAALAR